MNGYFTFHTAGEIVFGQGVAERTGQIARRLGLARVLIVTDKRLTDAGILEAAAVPLNAAGVALHVFDGGQAEPPTTLATQCAEDARGFAPDGVLGLGGGSNLDLAKIAAVLLAHGGEPSDYFGSDRVPGPVLPLIAVPTTAGTGSEVSGSAVLSDEVNQIKVSTLSNHLRPAAAIVDPELTRTCPAQVTADSGIDALTHAIEAYTAVDNAELVPKLPSDSEPPYYGAHPLGDALAEKAIALVGKHLATAVREPDNMQAREGMALAATLAGMAFSNCGVALVHALEYPLGAAVHCSHGAGNGLLLPYVMEFNRPQRTARLARVAELLGESTAGRSEADAARRAVDRVVSLRREIGIPHQLRELGAREDQLETFAAKAHTITRLMDINPRRASEQDLLEILRAAY
ncbi:MAG: iron-containing alcohol dehydrogenase [Pirellulales bacterium]